MLYGHIVGIGGLCGVLSVVLFLSGFFVGWKLRGETLPKRKPPPEPLSEDERRIREEFKKQNEAFQQLQNYSAADAYGMTEEELPHD